MKKLLLSLLLMGMGSAASAQLVTDGLIVHLDADSIKGLADGDPVTSWQDLATSDSADGSLSSVTGWAQPTYYRHGYNSRPILHYVGTDCLMSNQFSIPDVSKGVTVFVVATGDISGQTGERVMQIGQTGAAAGNVLGVDFSTSSTGTDQGSGARFNNGKSLVAANNPLDTNFHIGVLQMGQGDNYGSLRYYVDDMDQETFDVTANSGNIFNLIEANNDLVVGTGKTSAGLLTSDDYQGDVAEIIIYNNQLTVAQMQQNMDFLDNKYNRTTAWNPIPEDNSPEFQGTVNGTKVDVTLEWNTGNDPATPDVVNSSITKYFLYVTADEANMANVTPIEINAQTPPAISVSTALSLDFDKEYAWRVDQAVSGSLVDDPNTIIGPTWHFLTIPSVPVVENSPAHANAFPGDDDVVFTAEFSSISAMTYQWYSSIDNNNDPASEDDEMIVDATASTLSVSPDAANEKYYYCIATNNGGSTASDAGYLTVNRMVLYWDMEATGFTDASGNGHDPIDESELTAPLVTMPVQAADVPGDAGVSSAQFTRQENGDYTRLTAPLDINGQPQVFYTGYTVTLWVKTDDLNQDINTGLFNNDGPTNRDFQLELNNGNYRYNDASGTFVMGAAPAGEWAYLAVICDGTTTTCYMNLYGDTKLELNTYRNEFGQFQVGTNRNTDKPYTGFIDEVKVWNYPVPFEVLANDYTDVCGKYACLSRPEMDFNDDCMVNLIDLADIVNSWLDCNRFPETGCN